MTSPRLSPALAAGLSASRRRPARPSARLQAEAVGDLRRHLLDLHAEPAAARPCRRRAAARRRRLGDVGRNGEADADAAAVGEKIAVLMPITWPSRLKVGPPELPRLIGASIWMKSSYGPEPMSRPRAETMPAVTVPPRPNGLPTAITQSPTRGVVGVAEVDDRAAACSASTLISARSVFSSVPTSLAVELACRRSVVDGDLVGAVDDVVVGDDVAGRDR